MTSPPDKLFHDKLEHLRKTPPPAAWNRIESGLQKKKPNRSWLMIAAGVTILMAISITLWNTQGTTEKSPEIAMEKPASTEPANQTSSTIQTTTHPSEIPSEIKQTSKITPQPTVSKLLIQTTAISASINSVVSSNGIVNPPKENLPDIASVPKIESAPALPEQIEETNITGIPQNNKIIYSSNEVNARFLKKRTADIAQTTEKAPTGIQRIFDFAYGLKNEETSYGDLRGLKNEILSLPSKEKTRTQ